MGNDPLFENDETEVTTAQVVEHRRPKGPRFGLGWMMLIMFVACATSALGYYMVNFSNTDNPFWNRFGFIFVTLAAPMLILTFLSAGRLALQLIDKYLRRRYD